MRTKSAKNVRAEKQKQWMRTIGGMLSGQWKEGKEMKEWFVTFEFDIRVKAENKEDAIKKANDKLKKESIDRKDDVLGVEIAEW